MTAPLDPVLVEVLACPIDKAPLWWIEDEAVLYNPRLRKIYRVHDGIPDLLVDEAEDAGDADHERFAARAASGGVVETGGAGQPPGARSPDAQPPGAQPGDAQPGGAQPPPGPSPSGSDPGAAP